MLEAIAGALIVGIFSSVVTYFLPRLIKRFRKPLIYSYNFFPLRIDSPLLHRKVMKAEELINWEYAVNRSLAGNNLDIIRKSEESNKFLNEFIRNLRWLLHTDFLIIMVLKNQSKNPLKDISISFDFLSQITGYEFQWHEDHEMKEKCDVFMRDKIQSIKEIKALNPDKPIKIFIWGVVLEELKEKYTLDKFKRNLDEHIFVSFSGGRGKRKKRRKRI